MNAVMKIKIAMRIFGLTLFLLIAMFSSCNEDEKPTNVETNTKVLAGNSVFSFLKE